MCAAGAKWGGRVVRREKNRRGGREGGQKKQNKYVVYPNQGREYVAEGDSPSRMRP